MFAAARKGRLRAAQFQGPAYPGAPISEQALDVETLVGKGRPRLPRAILEPGAIKGFPLPRVARIVADRVRHRDIALGRLRVAFIPDLADEGGEPLFALVHRQDCSCLRSGWASASA